MPGIPVQYNINIIHICIYIKKKKYSLDHVSHKWQVRRPRKLAAHAARFLVRIHVRFTFGFIGVEESRTHAAAAAAAAAALRVDGDEVARRECVTDGGARVLIAD